MSELRMEKLSMESEDITKENVNKIKELFPQVVTEGKIDFDVLKEILGEQIESRNERYQFTWSGKSDSIRFAQRPSTGTLRPDKESSKDWDSTENLYIEGDNLEVLKLLQKSYHNKIKMIYIDPPYNTGGDFVYKDDFKDSIKNYKEQTNQTLRANPETSGRYHTDWLNMMYPRLMLAKNLLSDEGTIFVNIDEHEVSNLVKICNEIFGDNNELATLVWDKRNPKGDSSGIAYQHEYIAVFCKSKINFLNNNKAIRPKRNALRILDKASKLLSSNLSIEVINSEFSKWLNSQNEFSGGEKAYNKIDSNGEVYRLVSMAWPNKKKAPEDYFIPLIHPITKKECPVPERGWRNPPQTMRDLDSKGLIVYGMTEKTQPTRKYLLRENLFENVPSIIYYGGSDDKLLNEMRIPFDTPKVIDIIIEHISSFSKSDDVILDFFSGSASTAHAVMQLNAEDGGNRKFIMVQLPEKTDEKSEAFKAGFENICEIGKERIRRAGDKIKNELIEKRNKQGMLENTIDPDQLDIGFKVFKLDTSNLKTFDSTSKDLENIFSEDVFLPERSSLDILYEILLKYGVFDKPVDVIQINGKEAFSIAMNQTIVYINQTISESDVLAIAKLAPREVIFDERGFDNDNDKINALKRLETAGVEKVATI